jgi:hypothetical protein
MRDILLLAIHLLTTLVKLLRPSGARAIVAESLILKRQLLILNRSRRSAPHLTVRDRLLLGLATLVVNLFMATYYSAKIQPGGAVL